MSIPASCLAAADRVDAAFADTVAGLAELVQIPSCSFPGFDAEPLQESAAATAAWLERAGLPDVEVIDGPGPFPAVIGRDHRAGKDKPTVLLYAHHDVQPPGDPAIWTTPAYEPAERDGRLYGRGSADDKAGIAAHAAAIGAWPEGLPCNVTVLIEGEEEIGSPHLNDFIDAHLDKLRADVIVIADLVNVQRGLPTITVSLRGMCALNLRLSIGEKPLHSGLWGGPLADPAQILCRMLGSLADADGRLTIPDLIIPEPDPDLLADLDRVPFDASSFASEAGLNASCTAALPAGPETYRRMWYAPTLSINGLRAGGGPGEAGNVLNHTAWARLSLRLVAGQDPEAAIAAIEAKLRAEAPAGVELEIEHEAKAPAWSTATTHQVFAAAKLAFASGYGQEPVLVGSGGSIPFVGELSDRLGGIPALLIPVEDPASNAHGENESVDLSDLRKTCRSLAMLLGLLAAS